MLLWLPRVLLAKVFVFWVFFLIGSIKNPSCVQKYTFRHTITIGPLGAFQHVLDWEQRANFRTNSAVFEMTADMLPFRNLAPRQRNRSGHVLSFWFILVASQDGTGYVCVACLDPATISLTSSGGLPVVFLQPVMHSSKVPGSKET